MKTISKVFVVCITLVASYNTNAQTSAAPRPHLFNNFSANVPSAVTELNKAFLSSAGSSIQLAFGNNFSFPGTILSSVQRYKNLSSVTIKLPTLNNSILSISKRINDDNTVTYVGHIINEKYADGYELIKDDHGNYTFNKIKTADLIQDF